MHDRMPFEEANLFWDNQTIFEFYRTRLINVALTQFSYDGWPDTCDRLNFERELLFRGKAALIKDSITGDWLTLGYTSDSELNIYRYPKSIKGVGFGVDNIIPDDFVVCYDMPLRESLMPYIDMYARALAEVHMTFRINLDKQNVPFIVTTGRNQQLSMKNIMSRMQGFQRVFFMKKKSDADNISALDFKIPYIGMEILTTLRSLWMQAVSFLGVAPSDQVEKKERLNVAEVNFNREESDSAKCARMMGRLECIDKFNKKTGLNVKVYMNTVAPGLPTEMFSREFPEFTGDQWDIRKSKSGTGAQKI